MKKVLPIFVILGCLHSLMFSQITITKSDFDANYIGTEWIQTGDTISALVNIGTASASSQTFDFSGITVYPSARSDIIDYPTPAGHVLAGDFPSAVACVQSIQTVVQSGFTVTITTVEYLSSETGGVYLLGYAIQQHISPPPPPFSGIPEDTSYDFKFSPKALGYPLPLTYGTSTTATDTLVVTNALQTNTQITTRTFTANGFGTLTLPGGASAPAIRVVMDQVTTVILLSGPTRTRTRNIVFLTKDLTQMQFAVDTLDEGGSVYPQSYSYSVSNGSLAVREIPGNLPVNFQLYQNYPNPFNPETRIKFAVRTSGPVSLKVYDVLGREVATLVNKEFRAGEYEVNWDASRSPSGIYMVRLTARDFSQTKMMTLLR